MSFMGKEYCTETIVVEVHNYGGIPKDMVG